MDHDLVEVSAEALASLNIGLIRALEQVRTRPAQPYVASKNLDYDARFEILCVTFLHDLIPYRTSDCEEPTMTTPQTSLARNTHQASTRHHVVDERFAGISAEDFAITYAPRCWARHGKGSYRVPRERPPGRSVDRGDCCQGYGRYRPAGCSLRAVVVDTAALDRMAQHLGVA